MSASFEALTSASSKRLEEALQNGATPEPKALVGWQFGGFNVGPVAARLGIQKFIKGFFQSTSALEGYNLRVHQNGPRGPWLSASGAEPPERFGLFLVRPVDPASRDGASPAAFLLDYGASPRNPRGRIERLIRDYVVAPNPTDADVLLGKAYLALGRARLPAGFFVLDRLSAASPAR